MLQTEIPPKSPVRFAIWCTRPSRHWALLAFACVFIACIGGRVEIFIIGKIADSASLVANTSNGIDYLWFWALAFPISYLFFECFWRGSGYFGMRWIVDAEQVAYDKLYKYLTGHSASYFGDRFAGALTNKISNAAKGLDTLMAQALWQFFTLIIAVLGDLYLCWIAHPYFFIAIACWLIFYVGANLSQVKRVKNLAYKYAKASSDLKGRIVDSASNIDTVQQSGEVDFEHKYIGRYIDSQKVTHIKEWMAHQWLFIFNGAAISVLFFIVIYLCVDLFDRKMISVGTVVMIISLISALEFRLFFLGRQIAEAMSSYGQIEEGLEELLLPHDVVTSKGAASLHAQGGKIEFETVVFSYAELPVFEKLDILIKAGQRIGLVGPSGAGKSTFVNLLLRQYDVNSGRILIDDQSIADVELDSLRKQIAFVPQTTSLFHRTIMENIKYGRLDASDEEVVEAAKLAQADEFIKALPSAYQTFVGERGVKLSGGQRQRISIARAILKDAPILILDEATSSLDSESEEAIQQALEKVMQGRTVIAVAHRLSTLKSMDRILVLKQGKILEDGSHLELLALKGLYAKLWSKQVGGFIQE